MWIAVNDDSDVVFHHSDAPYSSFSERIVIASGITSDDIAAVTALPSGRIGVLWSNQETERFGFKTHLDGAEPSPWSVDEVPASGSASSTVGGMADDHLNIAVASDGSLYAAVKTSWDTSGRPAVALLVRRPSGSCDPLYPVDEDGTRGIVLLNEALGTVSVLYTESVSGNDIMLRTSSTTSISFGSATEILSGSLNNPTSTKATWDGQVLFIASTAARLSTAS